MVVLIGEDLSHATNTNITGDDEQALTGDKKTSTNRGVTIWISGHSGKSPRGLNTPFYFLFHNVLRDTCNKTCYPYYSGHAICVFKLVCNRIEKQRKTIHNECVNREIQVNCSHSIQVSFIFLFHMLILVSIIYYSSPAIHLSLFSVIAGSNFIQIITGRLRSIYSWKRI